MSSVVLIYVTVPSRDDGLRIGGAIVGERLAACANVLDGMTSIYHWEDQLQESAEAIVIFKTTADAAAGVVSRVRELHPYEVPAILVLPVQRGFHPFLNWVTAETRFQPPLQA
jgi:periplasmic divalent cation tolerance protein